MVSMYVCIYVCVVCILSFVSSITFFTAVPITAVLQLELFIVWVAPLIAARGRGLHVPKTRIMDAQLPQYIKVAVLSSIHAYALGNTIMATHRRNCIYASIL